VTSFACVQFDLMYSVSVPKCSNQRRSFRVYRCSAARRDLNTDIKLNSFTIRRISSMTQFVSLFVKVNVPSSFRCKQSQSPWLYLATWMVYWVRYRYRTRPESFSDIFRHLIPAHIAGSRACKCDHFHVEMWVLTGDICARYVS
jgi:hypothetical protein